VESAREGKDIENTTTIERYQPSNLVTRSA
jgi:hypothetical protein